jgi:hypothetical protein
MLDLKLVPTFKNITDHPSDDKVIKAVNITPQEYKEKVKEFNFNYQIQ